MALDESFVPESRAWTAVNGEVQRLTSAIDTVMQSDPGTTLERSTVLVGLEVINLLGTSATVSALYPVEQATLQQIRVEVMGKILEADNAGRIQPPLNADQTTRESLTISRLAAEHVAGVLMSGFYNSSPEINYLGQAND